MAWDEAPVTGKCQSFSDADGADGVSCDVILPAGAKLRAGTFNAVLPGADCTGDTVMELKNADGDSLSTGPGNDDQGQGGCSYVEYVNEDAEEAVVTIIGHCFSVGSKCTGTVAYNIRTGFRSTTVKNNKAASIVVDGATSDVIESNAADYSLSISGASDFVVANNSFNTFSATDAYTGVLTANKVEDDVIFKDTFGTIVTNNTGEIPAHTRS